MSGDRLYQVAFSLLPIPRASEAKALLEQVGSPDILFNNKALQEEENIASSLREVLNNDTVLKQAEKVLATCRKEGIDVSFLGDLDYPHRLAECEDGPLLVYKKGKANLNRNYIISIVGTRKSTPKGKDLTHRLVKAISDRLPDATIVSGLAYGIDITAHRAAMENGLQTVAVLAHGLDRIYPEFHRYEALEMQKNGCLFSELSPGTPAEPWRFLQRNRIVAGMSDACVVVESGRQGGSLNTASRAFEYNRAVFAYPGRPGDDRSAGCNRLIRSLKATLIENADDVMSDLGWICEHDNHPIQQTLFTTLTPIQQRIIALMDSESITLNELIARSGLKASELLSVTLEMQLTGLIESLPGNSYRLKG